MQPILVMPMNDSSGLLFSHLKSVTPLLKDIFDCAFVSVDLETARTQDLGWLECDTFFQVVRHTTPLPVGRDFLTLYSHAAHASPDHAVLQLCFIDRVAYALKSQHHAAFIEDMQASSQLMSPLIYQRSEFAWATHPRNYRALEQALTTVGEILFKQSLDFAWCHVAVPPARLRAILPLVRAEDMSILAELILRLRPDIQTRSVDWLAWEDPFIFERDASALKAERERSETEFVKRIGYVAPMLALLYAAANESGNFRPTNSA